MNRRAGRILAQECRRVWTFRRVTRDASARPNRAQIVRMIAAAGVLQFGRRVPVERRTAGGLVTEQQRGHNMRPLRRLAMVTVIALSAAACATMNVGSHLDRASDFAQYRTYTWGQPDPLPVGDPRLDTDPFLIDRLQGAVEKELAAKGFRYVLTGSPDLLVHYHSNVSRRIDVNRIDRESGFCYDETCDTRVVEYEAGTLILDVMDARTGRLIWRGWAQDGLRSFIRNSEVTARKIREAVKRMVAQLPPPIHQAGEQP
jgi:hypothetical protein